MCNLIRKFPWRIPLHDWNLVNHIAVQHFMQPECISLFHNICRSSAACFFSTPRFLLLALPGVVVFFFCVSFPRALVRICFYRYLWWWCLLILDILFYWTRPWTSILMLYWNGVGANFSSSSYHSHKST